MTGLIALFVGLALVGYFSGTITYAGSLATRSRALAGWGRLCLLAGAAIHLLALAASGLAHGSAPVTNSPNVLALYAFAIVVGSLFFEWRSRMVAIGAITAPLVFLALAVAAMAPGGDYLLAPEFRSAWLLMHVGVSVVGYAVCTLAVAVAVLYLYQDYLLRAKRPFVLCSLLPTLAATERLSHRLVALGFPWLTLTLLTGAVWSLHQWGTAWVWEPKQTMAFITWLIFGAYLIAYARQKLNGRRAAWLVIAGFTALLVTFFGVDLIMPGGLHDF